MTAANNGHLKACSILIEHNPNLLLEKKSDRSILLLIQHGNVCKFILEQAQNIGCLAELLTQNFNGLSDFENILAGQRFEVFRQLLKVNNLASYLSGDVQQRLLARARSMYWNFPNLSDELDKICGSIKTTFNVPPYPKQDDLQSTPDKTFQASCRKLFGHELGQIKSKEERSKFILAQFHELLEHPLQAILLLQQLDREFKSYLREKNQQNIIDSLDSANIFTRDLNGLSYYFPQPKYKGLDKAHSLIEFLSLLLKQHGLGEIQKWIGFVPAEKSNRLIREGVLFIEGRLFNGLFHGKISHILQIAILICWIKNGEINLSYVEDGNDKILSLKEILQATIRIKLPNSNTPLFVEIFDQRNFGVVTFCDPFHIHSIIMFREKELGLPHLQTFLIDSFCKGFLKIKLLCESFHKKEFNNFEFIDKLADMRLYEFNALPLLIEAYVKQQSTKPLESDYTGNPHAIFSKTYKPRAFIPFD